MDISPAVCLKSFFHVFNYSSRKKTKHVLLNICLYKSTVVLCTLMMIPLIAWPNDLIWLLIWLSCWQTDTHSDHSIPAVKTTAQMRKKAISDHNDCSACHFLPGVQMHTAPGRGHDLEVSLYGFIVSLQRCFLPPWIPTEPLIWDFINWVHRHKAWAPAPRLSSAICRQ